MGIYEKFVETYNTLAEVSARIHHFAEVLGSQGFKVVDERRTSMAGIGKIVLADQTVIKPGPGGFLEYDIIDLLGKLTDPSTQIDITSFGWFSIEGFYYKAGNGTPVPLSATLQVYKPTVSLSPVERLAQRIRGPKPEPIELMVILGYDYLYDGPMTSRELVARMADIQKGLQAK